MNVNGGGGPDGGGGSTPVACEVRVVNQAGGIMECLTLQEACARGVVDSSLCISSTASPTQLSNTVQQNSLRAVSPSFQSSDGGCMFCGGLFMLLVIANFILFRRKA
jgi:hypothetical protein